MGFLDKMFGKKDKVDSTKSMSQVLREQGIDPKNLDMKVAGDGTVTVKGYVISQGQRDKIAEALKGMPGIKSVNDQTVIGEPAATPEPQVASSGLPGPGPVTGSDASGSGAVSQSVEVDASAGAGTEGAAVQTYTVESGDTLWKIAEQTLGQGSDYMKIYEANRDVLDDPDKIFPGQVLKIPAND